MTPWLVAVVVGVLVAGLQYGLRGYSAAAWLRAAAVALIVALLLDAPLGRAKRRPPLVALDASASWQRGGETAWRQALDSARALRPDSVLLFGDSVRVSRDVPAAESRPTDAASRVAPAVERAAAAGRSLVVVTDGALDDPASLAELPPGSRVVAVPGAAGRDAALSAFALPRAAVAGDTLEAQVTVVSGAAGAGASELALVVGDAVAARLSVEALPPYTERAVKLRGPIQAADGPALVRAVLRSAGDVEPRNDTLVTVVEVTRAAGAVFASTLPDPDARDALAVLRGALAVPARAYWRVTPEQWRVDGSLAPIAEAEVRRALREAPVAVLHGDTAALGAPRTATMGALALLVPAVAEEGEWYATAAPPSPLGAALSGLPWDSLPPVQVGVAPRGDWVALEARLGRSGEPRAMLTGVESPRRVVVMTASGLWRWRFRGGASADAYTAVWGAMFDWLLAGRREAKPASLDASLVRAGEVLRWRRGATTDSSLRVVIQPRTPSDGAPSADTVTLRFAGEDDVAQSPPLAAGLYDVTMPGGRTVLAVNPSSEWVPRASPTASRTVPGTPAAEQAPGIRRAGWAYLAVVLALCAEWILRRRRGLR